MQQNPSTYPSNMNINLHFPEHEHLNCPRCDSNNTKFCYYNNYNLSQPRHYCKNCRRYWTKGGTLRKIPIGGGTRKRSSNKRPAVSSVATASPTSPAQQMPEPSAVFSFENSKTANHGVRLDDDSTLNSNDGFEKNDRDRNGESSGNGWPDLSIFTSGS